MDDGKRQNSLKIKAFSVCRYYIVTAYFTVTTFRDNDKKGIAPRALYKQFGFVEEKLLIENDYPVQRFVLRGSL